MSGREILRATSGWTLILPMRVLHIGHAPLCSGHPDFGKLYSHPGSWVVNHCAAQKSIGLDVELVTQVAGGSAFFRDDSRGFPIHYVPVPNRLRAATFFHFDVRRLSAFVRALRPDIVHAHGTEESYSLAAQATGMPTMITVQGCFFLINREMPPGLISRARMVEFTERKALRRARHVIAKSAYVAGELKARFPHLTIHEIPNTFDPALLEIPLEQPREPGSIAFVGSVSERKGLHILAGAVELLETGLFDANGGDGIPHDSGKGCLHIFGNCDRPDAYETGVLERLTAVLGSRLVLHGVVPPIEVAKKLARTELLVAPSLEEMFGNQVIEALLVGTWPVVSSRTAMEENVRRVGAGTVFENGDVTSLAAAIPEAFAAQAAWIRAATRDAVDARMGQAAVARSHGDLYQRVLQGGDSPPMKRWVT